MSEWREEKLLNLGEIITGKTPSKNNPEDWGKYIPFVTPSDFSNYGKNAYTAIRNLSSIGAGRFIKKIIPPLSVLVTCIGSDMGKVVMNRKQVITNQQINSIIPNNSVNNDFLYYSLVDLYETLRIYGGDGTAVPIINKTDFGNLEISLPPLPEQKAIAGVLSSLDDKIDLLHRQNKTLEAMAETLFRQWFIEEVEDDWKQYQLKNFVEHVKINIKPQDKPLDAFSHFSIPAYDNGQDPIIELGKEIKSNKYLVVDNSILVSKLNPITPRVWCVFKQTFTNPICSTEFQVLKPNNANQFGFFYSLLKSNEVVNELAMAASGTSGSHQRVKASDILNISFSVPDVASISKFSEAVECNLKKIVMNKESMGRLVKIRDILLPKLMSGEVRVEY
jgi:type I restriction enzyme S subunit